MTRLLHSASLLVLVAALLFAPSASAGCFEQYRDAVDNCSNLDSFGERSVCGLDAATELAGCVRRTIMG